MRAWGGADQAHFSFTAAARLIETGIPVALQSGFEADVRKTREVPFEAGLLLSYGVDFNHALGMGHAGSGTNARGSTTGSAA